MKSLTKNKRQLKDRTTALRRRKGSIIVIAILAVTGVYLIARSNAASATHLAFEADRDAGKVSGPAIIENNSTASNGKALRFKGNPSSPPASSYIKAFDTDWTINNPNWFTQAYNAGFRMYILALTEWRDPGVNECVPRVVAKQQIQQALDAGLKVAGYIRNPNCWQTGIVGLGDLMNKLQFFAIDVEDPGNKATRQMVDGIKGLGVRPVMYSGYGL